MNNQQRSQIQIAQQALQLSQKNETLPNQEQNTNIRIVTQAQPMKLPIFLRNISEKVSLDNINSNKNSDGYNFTKRQKWTQQQDRYLRQLISQIKSEDIDWERISEIMIQEGHSKTGKQCRERWFNQLDPKLNRAKWTLQENMELFLLHEQQGSRWKDIADHFEGRTDNSIKNQFFSLIRKSLRCARKLLDQGSNTALINKMKPKVLSEFMGRSINIKVPSNFTESKKVEEENLQLREFVKRFAFGDQHKFQQEVTDKDLFIIKEVIDYLITLNDKYINVKTKKINKKKKKQLQKFKQKQRKKRKKQVTETIQKNSFQEEKLMKQNNKLNLSKALQNLAQQKQELELRNDLYLKNPQYAFLTGEKEKIVQNLMKLGEIAYSMGQIINTSTRQEYEEFFNNQTDFFNQYLFSRQCSDESLLQKINIKELLNNSEKEYNLVQQQSYDKFFDQSFQINNCNLKNDNIVNLNNSYNQKNCFNPLNGSLKIKDNQQNCLNQSQPLFNPNQFNSSQILKNSQKFLQNKKINTTPMKGIGLNQNQQLNLNLSNHISMDQSQLQQKNNQQQLLDQSFKSKDNSNIISLPQLNEKFQNFQEKSANQIHENNNNDTININQKQQNKQFQQNIQEKEGQYLEQLIQSSNLNRNNMNKQLEQFSHTHNSIKKPGSIRIKQQTNQKMNLSDSSKEYQNSIDLLQKNFLFTKKMNDSQNKEQSNDIYLSNNSSINPQLSTFKQFSNFIQLISEFHKPFQCL